MIATLIGKNVMYKTVLPEIIRGNYSINDENDKILVNIESINGKWYVKSSNSFKIIDYRELKNNNTKNYKGINEYNEKKIDSIVLEEYSFHYILLKNSKDIWILYCAPTCEKYIHLNLETSSEIMIGNGEKNHIIYKNQLVKDTHIRMYYSNGKLLIENYDKNFGCFVNNKHVSNHAKLLFNGDVIFLMGLKIIIMGRSIFVTNPLNKVNFNDKMFTINNSEYDFLNLKEEDEDEIEIYQEKDYFAKAPRISNIIEHEKVKIDSPPTADNKEGIPAILTIGSTLSMGAIMLVSSFSTIGGLISGKTKLVEALPSLIIVLFMLIGMIFIPILQRKYEKKQKKKNEKKRQKRYKAYLGVKAKQIDDILNKQRKILFKNYISPEECNEIIQTKNSRLWERNIDDEDFLTVRLGIGDVKPNIEVNYPEEQFRMEDDNLIEILNDIGNKSNIIKNAPITMSLVKNNISALVIQNNPKLEEKFVQSLIIQLITLHSYEDLKLVFLLKEDNEKKWEHMKMLPHVWDNTKQIRFFADEYNDMQEISKYLEEDFMHRMSFEKEVDYKVFSPYYLIITDDYKKVEKLKIIRDILKTKVNVGFSILYLTDNLTKLPNECKTFISLDYGGKGIMFESEISSKNQKKFDFKDGNTFFFEKICKELSNIPIKYSATGKAMLPNRYSFLEMYNVGKIEQLNILERWKNNDSTISLQAQIGIDTSGMPIVLDIHEKFHGPHGLIAGSTGSGKSEFIITYILSLALNYHPDDVAFILIDYKGGGLAGAFQKREIKLPHLVGTITNIDTVGLQRSLASIQSELRRRQVMFNEARNKIDEGTIDIYKYQKLYHQGIVDTPIPHLLIICDEFAELKQQQEEFMNELISVARIGRSLGVHLILATQKPAGIVNDQIRSNSKFGICLKVQSAEDSRDVINTSDAANLKKAGQFYMNVGNNEFYTLGLAAWSGAPYYPSDIIRKKVDNSIEIISNIGNIIKESTNEIQKNQIQNGEQLTNLVNYMYELAKQENIKSKQLWMENIPETIYLSDIRKKYNVKNVKNCITPIIGEYDDPYNQRQGILKLDLSNDGNAIIFGSADSGKEMLICSMIFDTITNYSPEEVNLYLFDFGSEVLKIFKNSPHVGDVIYMNDVEKISRFFEMIQKEIKERTKILSNFGGNYNLYLKSSGKQMPMLQIIINNYEAFSEIYIDKYDDLLLSLTRDGIKCGVVFVITASASSDIRYRMSQNFKQKIALQLNNDDDYFNLFDGIGKKRPSHIFGRGLVKLEDIYEFQTAKICQPENWNQYIKDTISNLNKIYSIGAKPIPVLPKLVSIEDVRTEIKDLSKVPLGINKKNLNPYNYNFERNFVSMVTSKNIENSTNYILHVLEVIKLIKDVNIVVFDAEMVLQNSKSNLKTTYKNFKLGLENNVNLNKQNVCIIIGVDKFINDLENGEEEFLQLLHNTENLKNYRFILVDNNSKFKNREYDQWYKEYISGDTGIWIGNGVNDQYLISISNMGNRLNNRCGESFGYIIKQGEPICIKLLGIEEKGDDNG